MTRRLALPVPSGILAVVLGVVSLILAGCVNLPSGGTLRNLKRLPNSDESQLVITPRGPEPQWPPTQIVSGFLVASGADPSDLSIAKEYLTAGYAKKWRPTPSPQVIDANPKVGQTFVPSRVTGGPSSAEVTVSSQHLESLVAVGANEAGRLQVAQGPAPHQFKFELVQQPGDKWRISSILGPNDKPSDSILLLTNSDFERDYLPRNLYYLASGSSQTLVPFPVYIPAQPGQLGGVRQLVDAVRKLPPTKSNWLYGAIATALPRRTKPKVQVQASRAVVEFGGVTRIAPQTLRQMEAQLFWTLTYAPDSPGGTGINSVALDIGHRSEILLQSSSTNFTNWVPQGPPEPLYYQTLGPAGHPLLGSFTPASNFGSPNTGHAAGAAKTHGLAGGTRRHEPMPAGLGPGLFTAVAISPPAPPRDVRYFAGCRGTKAYIAPLLPITDVESRDLPGKCTSLSWDNQGDCWAVAGSDLYVLNATPTTLRVVIIPPQQIAQASFVSLRVAPDGLRVAMIVRRKNGASVYVSAITKKRKIVYLAQGGPVLTVGPDLVNPIALTWWNSDHLLVLEHPHGGVSQLYDVPVNGGESTKVLTPPNAISVTANGTFIAVETAGNGQPAVLASRGLEGSWVQVDAGTAPTYAG
jgi:hypothetical protein